MNFMWLRLESLFYLTKPYHIRFWATRFCPLLLRGDHFGSNWFLPIKTTKLKFYKVYKKLKPVPIEWFQFDLVFLNSKLKPNRLVSVWFGYFILKTKNYIVFWVFLDFKWVFSVWFFFRLVWFCLFFN